MGTINALATLFAQLSPTQIATVLVILSLLLAVGNHAVASIGLLLLSSVLTLLTAPHLISQVAAVRLALGLAIWIIVLVSAQHAPIARGAASSSLAGELPPPGAGERQGRRRARLLYRFPELALAGLMALGAWKTYPLTFLPATLNLAGYSVMALGLVMAVSSLDPLERGLSLLTLMSGFESQFLPAQHGLLIIGLISILDLVIALAVVYGFEEWVEEQRVPVEGAA